MEPIKKIMVALDFTAYSEELFNYAARIAEIMNAELIVANIINRRDVEAVGTVAAMGYEVDSEHYVSGIKQERRQSLDRILQKISFPAAKVRAIFKIGQPADELLKIVIQENIDLVVMGIKGRSDLEHFLVGSLAEKLFRRSPVPILSFRDQKSAERLRKQIHI